MDKLKLVILLLVYGSREGSTQSLPCHTTSGDNCTSSICPNTVVNYTCTITSGTPVGYTDWTLPTGTCPTNPSPGTIRLSQYVSGFCAALATSTCGPYTASSLPPSDATYCLSSILSVNVTAAMNGSTVMCSNTNIGTLASTVVSSATISVVASPGAPSGLQNTSLCTNSLTIQWTPASSGFNASSYSISVVNSTSTLATTSTNATIGDLIDGTNYIVSVTAINCAGSSNSSSVSVQTLPCAPVSVNVTTVLYQNTNNSVYDVELFWTHRQQSCSVPQYTVMVTSATPTDTYNNCTSSSCLYIIGMSGADVSSYNVSVACRNTLNQTGQPYVAMQSVPTPVLQVGQPNVSGNTATIYCGFPYGSYYCLVCCSPSVPVGLDGSGYLSSTNGIRVSVSLQGLTRGQMYYCKAAATNTNSNNCTGPVVGGVKVFFSFNTSSLPPTPSPTPSRTPSPQPLPSSDNTGTIVGVVVGVVVVVGVGGCGGSVVIVVVVVMWKNKGGKGKKREDTVELGKSTPPPAPSDGTGALYQDPNAIKHTQAPGGEVYAMADKPTKTSKASADKPKKPTATVVPADGGGAVYQDPKDIQHTTVAGGETYAVADKKPKAVDHVASPAGDLYAVADNKQPKRK